LRAGRPLARGCYFWPTSGPQRWPQFEESGPAAALLRPCGPLRWAAGGAHARLWEGRPFPGGAQTPLADLAVDESARWIRSRSEWPQEQRERAQHHDNGGCALAARDELRAN